MRRIHLSSMLLFSFLLSDPVVGEDWPAFRGPTGQGISEDNKVPTEWGEKKNLKWKLELPGKGFSSPIVVGKLVFVTAYSGSGGEVKRHLVCVDRDKGSIVWSKDVAGQAGGRAGGGGGGGRSFHGAASQTPVSDGERVYVMYSTSGVIAYDLKGEKVWQKSIGTGNSATFGSASSPIIWKDLLIVAACSESTSIYAFDRKTGNQVWKEGAGSLSSSYSTPSIFKNKNGEDELLMSVAGEVWGMNPATGKLKWYVTTQVDTGACTSLVSEGDVAYVVGGRSGGRTAFKIGGKDDISKSNTVWSKRGGTYVPSPVLYKGHLYWLGQQGGIVCADAKTGEEVGRQRIGGAYYASLLLVKDKLYAVSRFDGTYVIEADPKLKEIAHNKFSDSSDFSGSPAVSDGQLFIRSDKYLYCIAAQ